MTTRKDNISILKLAVIQLYIASNNKNLHSEFRRLHPIADMLVYVLTLAVCLFGVSNGLDIGKDEMRLFGGSFANSDKYKYHVAILQVHPNDTTQVICGGAIIDSRYVLTAAHCVYEIEKSELMVRSGWNVAPENPYEEERSYHKVAKIIYPKDYFHSHCRHHEHDIAILKVKKNFDLAEESQFQKIHLPVFDNSYDGYDVQFTGYGIHKIRKLVNKNGTVVKELPLYTDRLKFMITQVISNEECARKASSIITNTNICTAAVNLDGFTCLGDDGGPLVYDDMVIGIRNSHNNKCIHQEPEIYTRVSSYLGFIHKVLNNDPSYDIEYI